MLNMYIFERKKVDSEISDFKYLLDENKKLAYYISKAKTTKSQTLEVKDQCDQLGTGNQ